MANENDIQKALDALWGKRKVGARKAKQMVLNAVEGKPMVNTKIPKVTSTITKGAAGSPETLSLAKNIGSKIAKYGPVTGDITALLSGYNRMKTGHPWIGAGEMALGGVGGVMDLASLAELASGVGAPAVAPTQVAKTAAMAGGKKWLTEQLIKAAAKNTGKEQLKRAAATVGLDLMARGGDLFDTGSSGVNVDVPAKQVAKVQQAKNNRISNVGASSRGGAGYDSIENLINSYYNNNGSGYNNQGGGYIDTDSQPQLQVPVAQQTDPQALDKLLEYVRAQQEYNRPYQQGLENFINNYSELQRRARNNDIYEAAMAGLSGNSAYTNLIGKYNPAELEATKLDLINKLGQLRAGNTQAVGEMMGNAALAQQMGLPPEAALASKDLLQANTKLNNAMLGYQGTKYKADTSLKRTQILNDTKMKIAQLDNATKQAIAAGNRQLARDLQNQKSQTMMTASILSGLSYGDVSDYINATNALGYTNVSPEIIEGLSQGNGRI